MKTTLEDGEATDKCKRQRYKRVFLYSEGNQKPMITKCRNEARLKETHMHRLVIIIILHDDNRRLAWFAI